MTIPENVFSPIARKLDGLRRSWGRFILMNGLIRALMLIIGIAFLIITVEGFRYFACPVRLIIMKFVIGFSAIFIATPIILFFLIRSNRMVAYSNQSLAKKIGAVFPEIGDRLMNGIQLYEMSLDRNGNFSRELAEYSVQRLAADLEAYRFSEIIPEKTLKKSLIQLTFVGLFVVTLVFIRPVYFHSSAVRLLHPRQTYEYPLPFTITSKSGTFGVFGGDSVTVAFQCRGSFPDEIQFRAEYPDYIKENVLSPDENGLAEIELGQVRQNVVYRAYVENRSIFQPWRKISSSPDTIFVTDRPEILAVKTRIEPPPYTGLPSEVQESNNLELMLLPGSELTLSIIANKDLNTADLRFLSGKSKRLSTGLKSATGTLTVFEPDGFSIIVTDKSGVSNLNPLAFKLRIIPDAYPACQLISPDTDIELTEAMEIPLGIRISDDFGFSKALICYRLVKQYSPDQSIRDSLDFPIENKNLSLQELYYNWSIDMLPMSPEDAVEFYVKVYDNDIVNGPKSVASKTLRARFPSLNDLFADFYDKQDNIAEQGEETLQEMESTADALDKISREILKNPELSWEQKNQISQEMERVKKAGEKVSQMAEQMEDMIRESRENRLFDEETLEKYSQLQESFQEIMTPELREAMQKLQEAMEKMDQKSIGRALEKFRINREQFSRELDRMLKLLKRVKIEQSVDEIVRRLEDLNKRQEQISEDIRQSDGSDQNKLDEIAKNEKTVEKDTEVLQDVMQRTSDDMREFPLMPSKELQQKINAIKDSGLLDEMKQTRKSLNNGSKQKAGSHSKTAEQQLRQFLNDMQQFQADFNSEQMQQLMGDFRKVIYKTMQVSQSQEQMSREIKRTPRQSEKLMDVAVRQQQIQQNLATVIADLIALSEKTFGLSPKVGKGLGQAAGAMKDAIRQMEERNTSAAAQSANRATAAINRSALNLMNAMNDLQQSGSASGFEKYMEQLQKMAGQQQGINDETQMLGMGQGGQQQALQRLAARQQQLRKSLEELQKEMEQSSDQTGDLGGIAKDMDEVIKDLQQNRVLRKTLDRQQRILSRLLDAQKSMRTQDYKKERKSVTGEDISRESPGELPADLGERRTIIRENLEKALKEGYTREVENLIRQYFELISTDKNGE
ncbi:MAG: hypothetical protein DRP96_00445 [Candidatus Neomarinimicrobiota bacterium]|nr:MAG: hypothetical protein DRP96_00445 [Candidatus Neomarinimicrobiota bacterium]